MFREFKEFAMKGNVVDMAVGIIVGGAFGTIVRSLVDDVVMPPIGVILNGVDFSDFFFTLKAGDPPGPYMTLAEARDAAAVTLNYGVFLQSVVSFLLVAWVAYSLVKGINAMRRDMEEPEPAPELLPEPEPAPPTKECPYCLSAIPEKAIRCAYCTADLQPAGPQHDASTT